MKMQKVIPIFPLKLVVFPQSVYPLHIFEPRYKKLISKCLMDNTGFGIVAGFKEQIFDVGVYVVISEVIKKYVNGESDILIQGVERFLINKTYMHPDGYYVADVETYADEHSFTDARLEEKLKSEFENIIGLADYKLEESFWNRLEKSDLKSFKIAEKSGLNYEQQQELLILKSENDRINYLISYFNLIKDKVSSAEALKSIIMNNGYLN